MHNWKNSRIAQMTIIVQLLVAKAVRSLFLILDLNTDNDFKALSLLINFDQRYGPKNLSECFPNLTVLYLWIKKSEFLRL